jgi:hypothetical protein
VVAIIFLMFAAGEVCLAVPTLQLYSPGATYDNGTQTWVSTQDPFELWVVGATTPNWVNYISNVELFIAVPTEHWDPSATVTLHAITDHVGDNNPLHSFPDVTLTSADVQYGTPSEAGYFNDKNFPSHGLYPAYFWAVSLPILQVDPVMGANETVYDFSGNFDLGPPVVADGTDSGDIQYFQITYSPYAPEFKLHMDAIGEAHNGHVEWVFAPFSHDAETAIPEPGTTALLATGLVALACGSLRRSARKRQARS